jgi:tetratricopeptide (TPR) repeat protein
MAEDLRRYVNRFAIAARRPGPVERLKKWVRRHPGLAAGLTCALLAVCVAGFFAWRAHVAGQEAQVEKRRAAFEKAHLEAMSGRFAEADKAIAEAELLGASAGQLRMLRGLLAYYRSDYPQAVEHMEQAVKLMPDSVAARALLARVVGPGDDGYATQTRLLDEADRLPLRAPEDYLFKGLAECVPDPARGLATLDQAIRLRDTALGRLIRAEARTSQAADTTALADVQVALEDALVARSLLPDNPAALCVYVRAQVIAAFALRKARRLKEHDQALERAAEVLPTLERIPENIQVVWSRFFYHAMRGDEAAILQVHRQASRWCQHPSFLKGYAVILYQHGESEQALTLLERAGGDDESTFLRACILAEREGPGRARQLHDELEGRQQGPYGPVYFQTILRLLGDKPAAVLASRRIREKASRVAWRNGWYNDLIDYNSETGIWTAEQLLARAGNSQYNLCEAHFFIGMTCLADGDRNGAREHFRASTATPYWGMSDHVFSSALLARLEKDPRWPPWIPVRK